MDPEQQPSPSGETLVKTDWEVTSELLQCPAESKPCDVVHFSANTIRFSELHELPMPIDLGCLDEGNGIEATLLEHEAKWHKSCHTKFNSVYLSSM